LAAVGLTPAVTTGAIVVSPISSFLTTIFTLLVGIGVWRFRVSIFGIRSTWTCYLPFTLPSSARSCWNGSFIFSCPKKASQKTPKNGRTCTADLLI
jgi:hypothetical protein